MLGFLAIIIVLNGVAFAAFGFDKSQARNKRWRVSERTLLTISACGGWIGAKLGQHYFDHKTYPSPFRTKLNAIPYLFAIVGGVLIAIYGKSLW